MLTLNIEDIISNGNVRNEIGDVTELAASIERVGMLQYPLVVKEPDTDNYIVIAGHRRLAAAKHLNWATIRVIEQDPFSGDADKIAAQWAENTQRLDLTDWEKAQVAYDLKLEGLKQGEVAEQMGVKKSQVAEMQKIVRELTKDESLNDAVASQFDTEALLNVAESEHGNQAGDLLRLILDGEARDVWTAARSIESTNEIIAFYEEIGPLQKEWSEAGIQITTEDPKHHWGKKNQWGQDQSDTKVERLDTLGVELEDHITLDCHMVYIFEGQGWGKPGYQHWCMDKKLHTSKGKSQVKTPTAERDQERQEKGRVERKEERDDKTERMEQAATWINGKYKQTDLLEMAIDTALTQFREIEVRTAIAMLGLTKERPTGAQYDWYTKRLNTYLSDKFGDVDDPRARRWKIRMLHATKFINKMWPRQDVTDAMEPIDKS